MGFDRRRKVLEEAWVGDAVLCLYARERILREDGVIDAEKLRRMTSNQFLASLGEPSDVEAEIGRAYGEGGLAGASAWIEERLMPLFNRQEVKRVSGPKRNRGDAV